MSVKYDKEKNMSKCPIPWDKTFDKDKKYIWISETGKNTCDDCKSLDGKVFSGDKVPLRTHPNCKCEVKEYTGNQKNDLPERLPTVTSFGKKPDVSSVVVSLGLNFIKYDANNLFQIGLNKGNANYLKDTIKYETISDLKSPELEKAIRKRIKDETEELIKYGMPRIKDCPVYVFNDNSALSQKIVNSKTIDNFLRKNRNNIRFFNFAQQGHIDFEKEDDNNLYFALHGADIKGFHFDKQRKYFYCRVEDFYNFDPRKTDFPNQVGAELQKNGHLKPYYLIILLKIPVDKLY